MAVESQSNCRAHQSGSANTGCNSALDESPLVLADQIFNKVLAMAILVVMAPLVILSLLIVKLTSRGPAIYTQVRVGRGGRHFTIYKIRTMHEDSERAGPQWSIPGDPRITLVGRLLRVTHLDELPQLINVLRGEMVLVGPRPERPEISARLETVIDRYSERTLALPGLTGLAQVQLPPDTDDDSVRRKLACDLHYMGHRSQWMDFRLLVATATGVVGIPFAWTGSWLRLPCVDVILSGESDGIEPSEIGGERGAVLQPGVNVAVPAAQSQLA